MSYLASCMPAQWSSMTATSATTLVSFINTWVFQTALTALVEPRTLWGSITIVPLHIYLLYFAPGMWWPVCTIRMIRVLHSSQGLQLCCRRWHNASWCLCLAPAKYDILPLHYCYLSDAALSQYMFSFQMLSFGTIQSSLGIHRLPLHLLRYYCILQVWNILTDVYTL